MAIATSYKVRQYRGEEDLKSICELLNLVDSVDKLDDNYAVNDLRLELESPEITPARDIRVWEDSEGRMVAYGQMWIPRESGENQETEGYIYIRVHPDARHSGIETEIIGWAAKTIKAVGEERGKPGYLASGAREHDSYLRGVLEKHSFSIARYFFRMVRSLSEPIPEPQFPEGYILRHVETDEDVEKWVEVNNMSFIDHWNFHPDNVESHRHWISSPKYSKERDLIAVAPDGTFAAFCFCWIDPEDNRRNNRNEGWIAELGTRRGHRKIGLGRAMLLAGMRKLKADGVEVAKLGVDAENPTGALRLYESVGFTREYTSVFYRKDLRGSGRQKSVVGSR